MSSYGQLLSLMLPVFGLIAFGSVLRRYHWIEGAAETSLVRLVVNVCYPFLIFQTVVGNAALRNLSSVGVALGIGFAATSSFLLLALYGGRLLGLSVGGGLRTFALATGMCNYAYLPLPIIGAIWGVRTQGVLLVHNVGVEAALWTLGILIVSGLSLREGWKRLLSPVVLTLIGSLILNLSGAAGYLPGFVFSFAQALGACTVPLGLLMIGVGLANYLDNPRELVAPKLVLGAASLRLGLFPLILIGAAHWLPVSTEVKRVMVVQAAMPSGVIPIIIARHYGGQPLTAVRIVIGTTALSFITAPLWLKAGLLWAGVS